MILERRTRQPRGQSMSHRAFLGDSSLLLRSLLSTLSSKEQKVKRRWLCVSGLLLGPVWTARPVPVPGSPFWPSL